ncbi:MAG: SMC-Scp complex subunit ScpB [Oscillospiraceae bacterium]
MEIRDLEGAIEGILFASGEPIPVERIAAVLAVPKELIFDIADKIADKLSFERRGIRLLKLENSLQLCSAPEYSDYIRAVLETRKPPKLTQTALEVLSIVAYFQPVTRAYIEQVRGIDSSYTVGVLTERGLIEPCGQLDAPGRPTLFRTTKNFLRTFGISSLEELPELPSVNDDNDEQLRLKASIDALQEHSQADSKSDLEDKSGTDI